MEFLISEKELTRRKKAFATLLSSITVGLFLSSLLLDFKISIYGWLFFIILLLFLITITFHFFNSISELKIYISEKEIKKTNKKKVETFLLSDIKSVKVKRRTNGIIREIYITFNNQKELIITALEENFENIKNMIVGKADSGILLKETKELMDFDHPLFYSILGLPISFVSILFIKLITNLEHSQTKYILFAFSLYAFAIGAYFFIKRPMFVRFGRKYAVNDYIFGLIIICGGIFLFLVGFYR
jgi:ABC-type multidrug transport system fused ATPase/permease subunit